MRDSGGLERDERVREREGALWMIVCLGCDQNGRC